MIRFHGGHGRSRGPLKPYNEAGYYPSYTDARCLDLDMPVARCKSSIGRQENGVLYPTGLLPCCYMELQISFAVGHDN